MERTKGRAALLALTLTASLVASTFMPLAAGASLQGERNQTKESARAGDAKERRAADGAQEPAVSTPGGQKRGAVKSGIQKQPPITKDPDGGKQDDPDLPAFMRNKINEREYLNRRAEHIGLLRGLGDYGRDPANPNPRLAALTQLQQQEARVQRGAAAGQIGPLINSTSWTPVGPAPLPNGQTTTVSTPVSGRVTCIAIHPTNPDIVYVGTAQGGVFRSTNGGQTWTALMDTAASLAIGAIAINPSAPSTVFVGTGEGNLSLDSHFGVGLYRIINADTTPTVEGPFQTRVTGTGTAAGNGNAFVNNAITKIAVDPTDGNTIFVGTQFAFGGISGDINQLSTAGVYRSSNALAAAPTFSRMNVVAAGGIPVTDLVLEPGNPDNLIIGQEDLFGLGTNGIYRSTNARATTPTFTETLVTDDFENIKLDINKVSTTVTVIAAIEDANGGTLQKSTDAGLTWPTTLTSASGFCGGQCFYDMAPALDPTNANIIYLGGSATGDPTTGDNSSILKKATDGNTFVPSEVGLHADNHAVAVALSNPNIIYTGTDGGMWRSNDKAVNWTSLNNTGLNSVQFQSLALHPSDRFFTIGGTQDNGTEFQQPENAGQLPFNRWKRADFGDGGFARIDQTATDTTNVVMYHTYFNASGALIGFSRTSSTNCANEGQWAFKGFGVPSGFVNTCGDVEGPNGITGTDSVLFYAPLELGPAVVGSQGQTVYFGTDRLYRSINKGDTMVLASQAPLVANQPISAIGISPQDDNYRIVGLRNGALFFNVLGTPVMTSLDAVGAGSVIPDRYVAKVTFDPTNKNTAYITLSGFTGAQNHIYRVTNLDTTPVKTNVSGTGATGVPDVPVNAFAVDPAAPSTLYAGTDIGVYRSGDGGATWAPFGTGLPRVAVFDMAIQNPNRILRVATHGRGIWEIGLAAALTISGHIADASNTPQNGISVHLSGTSDMFTSTNASGDYSFTGLVVGGNYTVTPSQSLKAFAPSFATFNDISTNQTANFTLSTATAGTPPAAGQVIISEFRARGANGADDEFVELYNNTDAAITVNSTDGWGLFFLQTGGTIPSSLVVIPFGTTIPARGHFLLTGPAYSLGAQAPGDLNYSTGMPDNTGVALFTTQNPNTIPANRLDAAGFIATSGALGTSAFSEGTLLPSVGTTNGDYSFMRKLAITGLPQDTNDNATDFALVAVNGGTFGSTTAALGSPGPESLGSPLQRNAQIRASLVDASASPNAAPNRVRNTMDTGVNKNFGTLTLRRRFTNNTGAVVTRLRFRVVDITTLNSPGYTPGGAQADIRLLDSSDQVVGTLAVQGTLTEQPPTLALGGGLNTTATLNLPPGGLSPLVAGVCPPTQTCAADVQFVVGVVQGGSFRFFVNVEALP
jgi:photosystem II stability/assembly factor-like uncharacterized protein